MQIIGRLDAGEKRRFYRHLAGYDLDPLVIVAFGISFLLKNDHVKTAADAFCRTKAVAARAGGEPVADRSIALAACRSSVKNDSA